MTLFRVKFRVLLEFLRAQHGDDEVDEAGERDERDDDGFHGGRVDGVGVRGSADFFAEIGVGRREDEERDRERDEDEIVVHGAASIAPAGPRA